MRSHVNICDGLATLTALAACVLATGCAGRPMLAQLWHDPTTAQFGAGRVGTPGAMPPAPAEERRQAALDRDRAWVVEDIRRLETRLQRHRGLRAPQAPVAPPKADKATAAPAKCPAPEPQTDKPAKTASRPNLAKRPAGKGDATTAKTTKPQPAKGKSAKGKRTPALAIARRAGKAEPGKSGANEPKTGPKTEPAESPHPATTPRPGDASAMGDGTVPGELIAAARRLVGLTYDDERNTFLRHLLVSAAVDLRLEALKENFDARAVAVMVAFGWSHGRATALKKLAEGDLVYFKAARLVAVVESIDAKSGVATCIGPVLGRVSRFRMSLQYPAARRNEATMTILNDRIRAPRAGDDRVMAGELFTLALEPRPR